MVFVIRLADRLTIHLNAHQFTLLLSKILAKRPTRQMFGGFLFGPFTDFLN